MQQDFSKRISIVINKSLPGWQVLNCLANISAHFGHHLTDNYWTAPTFITKDQIGIPRNIQFPTIVFESDEMGIRNFVSKVKNNQNVEKMYFTKDMIEATDDNEIQRLIGSRNFSDINIFGVGVFGENNLLKHLTSSFKLWSS